MAYCLETSGLIHAFSKQDIVLNNINLQVTQGSIYGFLGPNGAGKTTTLRLILGLLKKQQGVITIFGKNFQPNRVSILKKIGSLIESPSLYGHLTAAENLKLLQKIYQCPKERIDTVLNDVGLPGTSSKKVSQFSLGMKQRLSIAVSLLNNPSLLILDEPTNGLDPNGIIEIRELLKKLNEQTGTTIIISSHLLPEIEKLATHVGIINKGSLMFQGTLPALISKQQQASAIIIETNDAIKTIKILNDNNITSRNNLGTILIPVVSKQIIATINRQLVNSNIDVYKIAEVKNDLETIFMELINN
ncbi:MAG TPA: ABC transporter ATP-binding protein [Chitinophagaceae bacterium]|nr:ABC transporter ATP-binding protein [Chitinophagaceae bacterium]